MSETPKDGQDTGADERRERAEKEKRERQQHEDYVKVIGAINRMADQQAAANESQDTAENKKAFRECLTIMIVSAATVVAITAVIVASCDAEGQRKVFQQQVGVMQKQVDATITQMRPWVTVETIRPENLCADPALCGTNPVLRVIVKNFGSTPALNIRGWFCYQVGGGSVRTIDFERRVPLPHQTRYCTGNNLVVGRVTSGGPIMPPGTTRMEAQFLLTANEMEAAIEMRETVFVWGYVTYGNPFNPAKAHGSHLCWMGTVYQAANPTRVTDLNFEPIGKTPDCNRMVN